MRYLSLPETFLIAEAVTGIPAKDLIHISRVELLDSALHAPQSSFEGVDFYPDIFSKAAVLCSRIIRNHPLPDGNKRLAWISMVMFLDLNGWELTSDTESAVELIYSIAEATITEAQISLWIRTRASQQIPNGS